MAGCHDRYHAVLMRSAWIGQPDAQASRHARLLPRSPRRALDKVRPGSTCADVHNACQAVIDKAGFTDNYRKRTGYSIGTAFAPDWGEGALLSLYHDVQTELEAGMAFHIPPALRRYGEFTVGVSETVIVTATGHKTLSEIPRGMLIYLICDDHDDRHVLCIVGPSGAGKDTLINYARNALTDDPRFVFPQRWITRPSDRCGENHRVISLEQFAQMKQDGGFFLDWQAHGLSYGIPAG